MESQIERGVSKKLIAFDADHKNIIYRVQNKKFRFSDSEEKVRAEAYVSLVALRGLLWNPHRRSGKSAALPDRNTQVGHIRGQTYGLLHQLHKKYRRTSKYR